VVGTDPVELRASHSNECMDLTGASGANGAPIQQWSCYGANQQKWTLQSVDSGPIPTETFLTVPEGERLNGEWGYVSAQGYVKSGGYFTAGQSVQITYEKEEGGKWVLKTTASPTLNSEGFSQRKYMELGPGDWRMKTTYSGAGQLAGSSSPGWVNFHLGTGYRFVFRHSEKCMSLSNNEAANGTGILQWACSPNPNDGQVFTLVPQEGGAYFNVVINSTDKCIDVTGASQTNGALAAGVGLQRLRPAEVGGNPDLRLARLVCPQIQTLEQVRRRHRRQHGERPQDPVVGLLLARQPAVEIPEQWVGAIKQRTRRSPRPAAAVGRGERRWLSRGSRPGGRWASLRRASART
jgi:hypothetical protein